MQRNLTTTEEVMHVLGGTRAVAELTGRRYTAAAHWLKFTAFPANTYLVMKSALYAKGCAAPDSLWGMTEPAVVHHEHAS